MKADQDIDALVSMFVWVYPGLGDRLGTIHCQLKRRVFVDERSAVSSTTHMPSLAKQILSRRANLEIDIYSPISDVGQLRDEYLVN